MQTVSAKLPGAARRDPARHRAQILDSAESCFRINGFHAASMGEIAAGAAMSVGHIYRYFENKEAVVAALVARALEQKVAELTQLADSEGDAVDALVDHMLRSVQKNVENGRAGMMLEVRAEAARNPRIAALLQAVNLDCRSTLKSWLETKLGAPDCPRLDGGVDLSMAIAEGLMTHLVAHPKSEWPSMLELARTALSEALRTPQRLEPKP
jgi:AcrR family transcriptional regulator